jgi:hypothetical protein
MLLPELIGSPRLGKVTLRRHHDDAVASHSFELVEDAHRFGFREVLDHVERDHHVVAPRAIGNAPHIGLHDSCPSTRPGRAPQRRTIDVETVCAPDAEHLTRAPVPAPDVKDSGG